jgi:hypothetical protein
MQREESVAGVGRTHGVRHQADVRFCHQRWPERQLYEVLPTSVCGWVVSLLDDRFPATRTGGPDPQPSFASMESSPQSCLSDCSTLSAKHHDAVLFAAETFGTRRTLALGQCRQKVLFFALINYS